MWKQNLKNFLRWHWQSGAVIGQPVFFLVLLTGIQYCLVGLQFIGLRSMCQITGYYCAVAEEELETSSVANQVQNMTEYLDSIIAEADEAPVLNKKGKK